MAAFGAIPRILAVDSALYGSGGLRRTHQRQLVRRTASFLKVDSALADPVACAKPIKASL